MACGGTGDWGERCGTLRLGWTIALPLVREEARHRRPSASVRALLTCRVGGQGFGVSGDNRWRLPGLCGVNRSWAATSGWTTGHP